MRDLSSLKNKLVDLKSYFAKNENILTVYLFGSYGTKNQNAFSDIDIAVLFETNPPFLEELYISAEVCSLLGRDDIDLVNLKAAPVLLQHQIVTTGEKIFERTPERTQDFVEEMLEEHHDYAIIMKKFHEDFRRGLLEEYNVRNQR